MSLIKDFKKALGKNENGEDSFVEFFDENGNKVTEEDVHFTVEGGEKEEYLTCNSPDVHPHFDNSGNFPVALAKEGRKSAYLKVSGKTGEVFPIHAGCCPVLSVIFIGAPRAGKTVYFLQLCDPDFHNMMARGTSCSLEDDLPSSMKVREKYEEARSRFKSDHVVPAPNRKGETVTPYYFYIQNTEHNETKRMILRLDDIDGEQCTDLEWENKVFQSNIFFITIGADELLEAEQGMEIQYPRVINQLLPRLNILRRDKEYQVRIMITKCDRLDLDNELLSAAKENSVFQKDGRLYQSVHGEGFDFQVFRKRSDCVRNYMKEEFPNFYNQIIHTIPEDQIDFCMIASIGEECENDHFKEYKPMFIDEPILSVLAQEGMYPVKTPEERPEEEAVDSTFRNFMEKIKGSMDKLKEKMKETCEDGEREGEEI